MNRTLTFLVFCSACSAGLPELASLSANECTEDSDCDANAFELCIDSQCMIDPLSVDNDNDQFSEFQGDCDDEDPTLNPNAIEVCGDDIDQNCDGTDVSCSQFDSDSDGFTVEAGDCDDQDDTKSPGLAEICDDGIDNDCRLETREPGDTDGDLDCDFADRDFDGYTPDEGDCDDNNPRVYPFAREICGDLIDENCDELIPSCDESDEDRDGFAVVSGGILGLAGGDCDDAKASINPNAAEICEDGVDQNCGPELDPAYQGSAGDRLCPEHADDDGDGFVEEAFGGLMGGDCNDNNASRYPGALEACNLIDDNCDNVIDELAFDCTNFDLQGQDISFAGSTTVSGFYFNVGHFTVNNGVTLEVLGFENEGSGRLRVEAQNITINGTIDASGTGFGGGGGGGGGQQADSTGCDDPGIGGRGFLGGYSGDNGGIQTGSSPTCAGAGGDGGDGGGTAGGGGGAAGASGGCSNMSCVVGSDNGPDGADGGRGGYLSPGLNGDTSADQEVYLGSGGGGGGGAGGDYGTDGAPNCSTNSQNCGGGGGAGNRGGGAIELIATGALNINGTLNVNGEDDATGSGQNENGGNADDDCTSNCSEADGATSASSGDGGPGGAGGILLRAEGSLSVGASARFESVGGNISCSTNSINASQGNGSIKVFSPSSSSAGNAVRARACSGRVCHGSPGGSTCTNL